MIGVLHTTESQPGTFPGLLNWFSVYPNSAPHVLYDPWTEERYFYFAPNVPSKSLRNLPGGVETNNRPGGVYQIEIVGYSADVGQYPKAWYDNLRAFLIEVSALAGVEYVFYTYPFRFSFAEWMDEDLSGWYGHRNVPENDHTDPGTLNLTLLATQTEPDVNLTDPISLQTHDQHGNPTGPFPGTVETTMSYTHDEAARAAGAARDARDNALAAVTYAQAASVKADAILDAILAQPTTALENVSTAALVAELSRRLGLS